MNDKKTNKGNYFPGQRLRTDANATGYVDCHHDKVVYRLREIHEKSHKINKEHKQKLLEEKNLLLFNHLTEAKPMIHFSEFDKDYEKSKKSLAKRMPGMIFELY